MTGSAPCVHSADVTMRETSAIDGITQGKLLEEASGALDLLLCGKQEQALKILETRKTSSPWHALTLGMTDFVSAALGQQQDDLAEAAKQLSRAEALACSTIANDSDPSAWWKAGTVSNIIQSDTLVLSAMCLFLDENWWSFVPMAYKLNKSFRLCARTYKEVFSGLDEGLGTEEIAEWISARHIQASRSTKQAEKTIGGVKVATVPAKDAWTEDPVVNYVVTATCYGKAIFDLIFSLLPGRLRTLVNICYAPSSAATALNLLHVAAEYGSSMHSSFASLAILTYHTTFLSFCPWVEDRQRRLRQSEFVIEMRLKRQPDSVLWLLHKAKIARAQGELDKAIALLDRSLLAKNTWFPQSETILTYELLWCALGAGDFARVAKLASHLTIINSWGQPAYLCLALGALLLIPEKTEEQCQQISDILLRQMPRILDNGHQALGRATPSHKFLAKRLGLWKEKRAEAGEDKELQDVISISPALELALHFQCFATCSKQTLSKLHTLLKRPQGLETPAEKSMRALLQGSLFLSGGRLVVARTFLEMARATAPAKGPYAHVKPLALCELAALELKIVESSPHHVNRTAWMTALDAASRHIEELLAIPKYDHHFRLEIRAQMLRIEIATKRDLLRLQEQETMQV